MYARTSFRNVNKGLAPSREDVQAKSVGMYDYALCLKSCALNFCIMDKKPKKGTYTN